MARNPRSLAISPPASVLEVDPRVSPNDDFLSLDSRSLSSDVYQYEYENGRRYHGYKAGSYPLPNDDVCSAGDYSQLQLRLFTIQTTSKLITSTTLQIELDRIDLKHHVMRLLCNGHLHLAPIVKPQRILDIGTGTGIWAIEMSEQYPEATVIGTDLSPIQPEWVPDNLRFEIDDVEAREWTWPDNHFDYIHSRFMLCSIGNWPRMIRKAFQHCKPGGYFELQELDCRFVSDDGSLREDHNLSYWSQVITQASANYNRPIPLYSEYFKWFEKAGFVDIKQVILKSPTSPWPKDKVLKEIGKFQLLAHTEGLEGISLGLLTRGLEWKADEVKVLLAKVRPELKDRSIHSYQTNVIVVGRKPETPPTPDSYKVNFSSAPRTPGSSTTGPRDTFTFRSKETSKSDSHNIVPQAPKGDSPENKINAFTPVLTTSHSTSGSSTGPRNTT